MALFIVLCLVFYRIASIRSQENYTDDNQDCVIGNPEFSPKNDVMMLSGKSFQLNCSVVYKHSSDSTSSEESTEKTLKANVSECSNSTFHNFNINLLKILRCKMENNVRSCREEKAVQLDYRTISITKLNVSVSDSDSYFCQYNKSGETEASIELKIVLKPVGPDPEHVNCISVDLNNLRCSWKKSEADKNNTVPVLYSSYFNCSPQLGLVACHNSDGDSCSITEKDFHPNNICTFIIEVTVDATDCPVKRIYEYNINNTEIVKLSKPKIESVIVESRTITLTMCLSFDADLALTLIKTVLYEVSYRSEYSLDTINKTSSDPCINVTLSGLIPFTKYTITVRIKGPHTKGDRYWSDPVTTNDTRCNTTTVRLKGPESKGDIYWSDPFSIYYTTKAEIPDVLPKISAGGFSRHEESVYVYVKPISKQDRNSENATYQISICGNKLNVPWENTTIRISNIISNSTCTIKIKTENDKGESRNTAQVVIPAADEARGIPKNIVAEKSHKDYIVMWDRNIIRKSKLKKIVVYWCRGDRLGHICKNAFNWTKVMRSQTNITLKGLQENVDDWMFAVSYQYTNGYNTGMIFADCYFTSITAAPAAVAPFSVFAKDTTELLVKPIIFCSNNYPSRPLQYVVYYKETDGSSLESCDETFLSKTTTATIETKELVITNLKPATAYNVCVRVVTAGGYKTSKPYTVMTLSVGDAKNQSYIILISVLGAAAVITIAFFILWKVRKTWKEPIEFILPKINPNVYEKVSSSNVGAIKKDSNADSGLSLDNNSSKWSRSNGDYSEECNEQAIPLFGQINDKIATNGSEILQLMNCPNRKITSKSCSTNMKEENDKTMKKKRNGSYVTNTDSHVANMTCRQYLTSNQDLFRKVKIKSEIESNNHNVVINGVLSHGAIELQDKITINSYVKESYIRDCNTKIKKDLCYVDNDANKLKVGSTDKPYVLCNAGCVNSNSLKQTDNRKSDLMAANDYLPHIDILTDNRQSNISPGNHTDIKSNTEHQEHFAGNLHGTSNRNLEQTPKPQHSGFHMLDVGSGVSSYLQSDSAV